MPRESAGNLGDPAQIQYAMQLVWKTICYVNRSLGVTVLQDFSSFMPNPG
jgi:hypothetical protein